MARIKAQVWEKERNGKQSCLVKMQENVREAVGKKARKIIWNIIWNATLRLSSVEKYSPEGF